MINKIQLFWTRINKLEKFDPDTTRRGRLLNTLLVGLFALGILGIGSIIAIVSMNKTWNNPDNILLLVVVFVIVLGGAVLLYVNQRSVKLASFLFLIFLSITFTFSDVPSEIANGRSSFIFFIPIAISSLLLTPASSFVFAFGGGLVLVFMGYVADVTPNAVTIISGIFLALISWLSARSLEQALQDLRVINADLDKIVEQKTQELANTLSRELVLAGRNHAILNSIADGVIVFDAGNRSILANPALSHLTNTSMDDLIDKGMMDFVQKEALAPSARGTLLGMFDHPEASLAGKRIVWGHKTLSASVARVQDDLGGNLGVVGVFRDVTREVELENMKNTFMAIVSHELRTPLNAILGFAEMLKEGVYGSVNDKQQNISGRIMNNTQRLLGIVSDLLDQAQIEAGRLKIHVAPCRPAEMLDALQGVMQKIAVDKGIEFITELDPSLPPVILGDPQRLQQIMVNLANNAIKFTEKGNVSVNLSRLDETNWQIRVTDTGGGIPAEAQEYIFETFRQVDGASTRQHGGVGLGLSIVKQLVELMKGKITLHSEIGKGSVFLATLPLITHEGAAATTPL
jgi:PAS domain S-box-containing protein